MKTKSEFNNGSCLQFKRTLVLRASVVLLCLAAVSSPAQTDTNQGEISFRHSIGQLWCIWTNNLPNGWTPDLSGTNAGTATGMISGPLGTYLFALFSAPITVTTVEGGTPWTDPNWAFTGNYATNIGGGKINGNYNPDNSVTIPGYAPGSSASLVVIGWNTAVGGTTLDSFETAWNQHAVGLYYGCSSLAHLQLGNGASIPNVLLFGSHAGQIGGFVMAPLVIIPTVAVAPQTQTAELGSTVDFTANAAGLPPLSFQWFFNSTNAIPSATDSILRLTNVQASQAGAYTVVVTNAVGAVTSSPAMLVVTGEPIIITSPLSRTAFVGSNTDFSVDATGALTLSYQWFFNGTNVITGATNSVLQLANVQISQSGAYTVVVTNKFGAVTSSPAIFTVVGVAPTILTSPVSRTTVVGATVAFSVITDGSPPVSYQWFFNGTNVITGATDSAMQLTNVQIFQSGAYAVVVANDFGAITSSPAMLAVVSSMVVTNCTEAALRAAMAEGGTVIFACDGPITLSNTITIAMDTVLDANGHQITISGNNNCRVFFVNSKVTFTLIHVTIANGLSTDGYGGGIYNGGTLNATNCHFIANRVQGAPGFRTGMDGTPGCNGYGGAVYNSGAMNIVDCSFAVNSARGGEGGPGNPSSVFSPGCKGGVGGTGNGGAICNLGILAIDRSLFVSNTATGGNGGAGGDAWASVAWPYISPGGAGGDGGGGAGGVLFNVGTAGLENCTLIWSQSAGGAGGTGGHEAMVVWEGHIYYTPGGPAGSSGYGFGVIYNTNGLFNLTNCTLAFNSNGGGIVTAGGGQLINTLLANNVPTNCSGTITDAGHNLSSDGSCAFTGIGSRNNVDPKLGPPADNGGSTLTMALLPGSPAIDAGDNAAAPATDQRGYPRPVGFAADIGAYECSPPVIPGLMPCQTAEMGAIVDLRSHVHDPAPLYYQWFFNGNAIAGCTNCNLYLSGIQMSDIGLYSLVVSNQFGSVTSSPAMLNVIPRVERRPVPGVKVTGEAGSLLNVDYANALIAAPGWTSLGSVSLTSTSQFCPDLTVPLPPQRFYRVWQTGTPSVVPSLDLNMVPAITLTGNVGDPLRVDYINPIGPTDAWVTLDTVTLTNTLQLYFDVTAPGQRPRLYRIMPGP